MAGNRLLARLTLKRCISDDAVPASLRCATIVVGKRLFLFPKGRDGMCDLQFAMVITCSPPRPPPPLPCWVCAIYRHCMRVAGGDGLWFMGLGFRLDCNWTHTERILRRALADYSLRNNI
jgi:hypothetical protein